MTQPDLIERITRSLAYMLRHQPEKFDLALDPQGFGELDDVVRALTDRLGEPIERGDVEAAVTSGDRPRYELQGTRIRALYGHSIPVEPGEAAQPPEFLYVGIDSRDVQRAQQFGLRGGRRRFLHLALTPEDAREAGRRAARDYTILRVFGLDAWEEGVNFYDRKTLFLAEHIPTEYLEVLERGTDGYEPRFEGRGEGRPEMRHGDERRREHGRPDRHGERREAPRGGDRAREERGPEPERGVPSFERPHDEGDRSRGDRGDRGRRGGRDRGQREPAHAQRGDRREPEIREPGRREYERREGPPREGPPREGPPREAPRRPAPPAREPRPAAAEESSFGVGVFEEQSRPTQAKPSAPPPPPPSPAPAPRRVEEPLSDFGAGL